MEKRERKGPTGTRRLLAWVMRYFFHGEKMRGRETCLEEKMTSVLNVLIWKYLWDVHGEMFVGT